MPRSICCKGTVVFFSNSLVVQVFPLDKPFDFCLFDSRQWSPVAGRYKGFLFVVWPKVLRSSLSRATHWDPCFYFKPGVVEHQGFQECC